MANTARALAEAALRTRKLDRTLTTALPPLATDTAALAATQVSSLDAILQGGLPRGQLCELIGPRSSGRTTLLLQLMAAATTRGEIVALIDTCDRFDVASAQAAGVDLERLLWVRGQASERTAPAARQTIDHALDRALKALSLVLQAGGFGVVAIDLADVALSCLSRLPFTTWLRLQRLVEGRETACVLMASQPLARSAGGLTLSLRGAVAWAGASAQSHRLEQLHITTRVMSPRRRLDGEVTVAALA